MWCWVPVYEERGRRLRGELVYVRCYASNCSAGRCADHGWSIECHRQQVVWTHLSSGSGDNQLFFQGWYGPAAGAIESERLVCHGDQDHSVSSACAAANGSSVASAHASNTDASILLEEFSFDNLFPSAMPDVSIDAQRFDESMHPFTSISNTFPIFNSSTSTQDPTGQTEDGSSKVCERSSDDGVIGVPSSDLSLLISPFTPSSDSSWQSMEDEASLHASDVTPTDKANLTESVAPVMSSVCDSSNQQLQLSHLSPYGYLDVDLPVGSETSNISLHELFPSVNDQFLSCI